MNWQIRFFIPTFFSLSTCILALLESSALKVTDSTPWSAVVTGFIAMVLPTGYIFGILEDYIDTFLLKERLLVPFSDKELAVLTAPFVINPTVDFSNNRRQWFEVLIATGFDFEQSGVHDRLNQYVIAIRTAFRSVIAIVLTFSVVLIVSSHSLPKTVCFSISAAALVGGYCLLSRYRMRKFIFIMDKLKHKPSL